MAVTVGELNTWLVKPEHLQVAEFCYALQTDFQLKPKEDPVVEISKRLVNGLGNSSGGIVTHVSQDETTRNDVMDRWVMAYRDQLKNFLTEEVLDECIKLQPEGKPPNRVHVFVRRFPTFVTFRYGLYSRTGAQLCSVKQAKKAVEILTNTAAGPSPGNLPRLPETLKYGDSLSTGESEGVEFKSGATKSLQVLLNDARTQQCMFAMPNLHSGGVILFGIDNDSKIVGQPLSPDDEPTVTTYVEEVLTEDGESKEPRLWGSTNEGPRAFLKIRYIPVEGCPDAERRVVLSLEFTHCPGGVFMHKPLAYQIDERGEVHELNTEEWKARVQSLNLASAWTGSLTSSSAATTTTTTQTTETTGTVTAAAGSAAAAAPRGPCDADNDGHSGDTDGNQMTGRREWLLPESESSTLASTGRISFTKNTLDWTQKLKKGDIKTTEGRLPMTQPLMFIPEESVIISSQTNAELTATCLEQIKETHKGQRGVVISCTTWLTNLPSSSAPTTVPRHHQLDLVSFDDSGKICLWVIWSGKAPGQDKYCQELGRQIKFFWMSKQVPGENLSTLHLEIHGWYPPSIKVHFSPLNRHCDGFFMTPKSQCHLLNPHLSQLLTHLGRQTTYVKQRLGDEQLMKLTQEQAAILKTQRYNFVEGPPGSGKTVMALYICETMGKHKTCVLVRSSCLQKYYTFQGVANCQVIASDADMEHALAEHFKDMSCLVVDDGHRIKCSRETWFSVFQKVKDCDVKLFVFSDNREQNYQEKHTGRDPTIADYFTDFRRQKSGISRCSEDELTEIMRNTQKVATFITSRMEGDEYTVCHEQIGDDVEMRKANNLRSDGYNNDIINILNELTEPKSLLAGAGMYYECREIVLIVDSHIHDNVESYINFYLDLLKRRLPGAEPQRADVFPVRGVTVTSAEHFSGLESQVVVLVMPDGTHASRLQTVNKFMCYIASRAISRVMFVTGTELDTNCVKMMKADHLPKRLKQPTVRDELVSQRRTEATSLSSRSGSPISLFPPQPPAPRPPLSIFRDEEQTPRTEEQMQTKTTQIESRPYYQSAIPIREIRQPSGEDWLLWYLTVCPLTDHVLMTDWKNHCVRVFTSDLDPVRTFGSRGAGEDQFLNPTGITVAADGSVFVCDYGKNRIKRVSLEGVYRGVIAPVMMPEGLSIDRANDLLFVCEGNHVLFLTTKGARVRKIPTSNASQFTRFSPNTRRLLVSWLGGVSCMTHEGEPLWTIGVVGLSAGLTTDGSGHVLVADFARKDIMVLTEDGGQLVTRIPTRNMPRDVALTSQGNIVTSTPYGLELIRYDPTLNDHTFR